MKKEKSDREKLASIRNKIEIVKAFGILSLTGVIGFIGIGIQIDSVKILLLDLAFMVVAFTLLVALITKLRDKEEQLEKAVDKEIKRIIREEELTYLEEESEDARYESEGYESRTWQQHE